MILAIILVGALVIWILQQKGLKYVRALRDERHDLLRAFRALVNGIKELKLNASRRMQALEAFETHADNIRHLAKTQSIFVGATGGVTQLLFLAALGLALFDVNGSPTEAHLLTAYSVSIVFMIGPLAAVVGLTRNLREASVALDGMEALGLQLEHQVQGDRCEAAAVSPRSWKELSFVGVTYSYDHEDKEGKFVLGPIDLAVCPGEVVFIIGANGSGKTTFAKIMTGLYPPHSGGIYLDSRIIGDTEREWYRQHFSAIFNDYLPFEKLLGPSDDDRDARVVELLHRLRIEQKVKIQDRCLSAITSLSQGESKRLALLHAYLEDRPIYLFDEWAADQDPVFKDVFYHEILCELKSRGKLVVVISHDSRYFAQADKILTLERGVRPLFNIEVARELSAQRSDVAV
jgi:putative ATP-binding cassette transporter